MTLNINLYRMGSGGYKFQGLTAGFLFGNGIRNGGKERKKRVCIFGTIPADTVSLKHLKRNTY
jgi:hypothetical protein